MTEFKYGRAIVDSFGLLFSNLYIFVPVLLVHILSSLGAWYYYSSNTFSYLGTQTTTTMPNLGLIVFYFILLLIVVCIGYGWSFALIGQILKEGKASLFKELKNSPKRAITFFLIRLIYLLVWMVLWATIIFGFFLNKAPTEPTSIFLIVFITALFLFFAFMSLAFMYVIPLISLYNTGPIKSIKFSFKHLMNNKAHSLALLLIIFVFKVVAAFVTFLAIFLLIASLIESFSPVALMMYMVSNPSGYTVVYFFASIPAFLIYIWSFVFLTIAYVRKRKSEPQPA